MRMNPLVMRCLRIIDIVRRMRSRGEESVGYDWRLPCGCQSESVEKRYWPLVTRKRPQHQTISLKRGVLATLSAIKLVPGF